MDLYSSVAEIKGVGEKRRELLSKLNIFTVKDLLYFFPRKYEDRRNVTTIIEAPFNEDVLLEVRVVKKVFTGNPYSKKRLLRVLVEDNTGNIELLFFNAKFIAGFFNSGDEISLYGKITLNNGRRQMAHPEFHRLGDEGDIRGLFPVYPLTDGLTQAVIRGLEREVRPYSSMLTEWLPDEIVEKYNLASPAYAVENIHFPLVERAVLEGRYRLIFEELLVLQTGLFYIKEGVKKAGSGVKFKNIKTDDFENSFKFELTPGQKRAFTEIERDLESDKPMNRLVQGDVGSGKTAVAELSMYKAVKSGFQAVMMAPTELLAKQHISTLKRDFEPFNIRCELLSGSTKKKERDEILTDLKDGKIDILVGTHAVIQPDVVFKKLGLVVTDEQHRFGVNQRTLLTEKGENPNVLVMTATPIPRTLAVILYGDLDISIIDSLPKGRKPIRTFLRYKDARPKIYDFVRSEVKKGRQAYIVCPLIEESDSLDLKSAEEIFEEISEKYKDLKIGLVHGNMKQKDKDAVMEAFLNKEIDVLVSTVVIEVGIDVPNANVMVIENCERFGLAQLHQLRGRVGRGLDQSYCILISGSESEIAKERNEIMVSTTDGFKIAEEDLKLRGPGEIFGTRQHGIPELRIADLVRNVDILEKVRVIAREIIDEDPGLTDIDHIELKNRIKDLFGENISINI